MVTVGDWVLKFGHPDGYQAGRPPVARLGRVLGSRQDSFVTDCRCSGGDSGGPYFDLDGRLVGIVGGPSSDWPLVDQAFRNRLDHEQGFSLPNAASPFILARLADMKRGEVHLSHESPQARVRTARALSAREWSNGLTTLAAYRWATGCAASSVVSVLDGDSQVALGTVADAGGSVLTVASQLPAQPRCRFPDGRLVGVEVGGVDPAYDLALLKVPASEGLRPITWASEASPPAGTLLVAAEPGGRPLAAGIVSVPRRDYPGLRPSAAVGFFLGAVGADPPPTFSTSWPQKGPVVRGPALPPSITGSTVDGRGFRVESAEGAVAEADIRPGDVIVALAGRPVRSHEDLLTCVRGFRGGDRVDVRLLRAALPVDVALVLLSYGSSSSHGSFPFGVLSARRDGFPTVFGHDLPLAADECGGPVVDLDGKAVGITVARTSAYGCEAVPADCLRRLLPALKAGKSAGLAPVATQVGSSYSKPVSSPAHKAAVK